MGRAAARVHGHGDWDPPLGRAEEVREEARGGRSERKMEDGGAGRRRRRGIEGVMRERTRRWGSGVGLLAALEEETRESGGWARVRADRWAGWMGLSGRLGWASLFPLQLSFLHNFYRIGKKT